MARGRRVTDTLAMTSTTGIELLRRGVMDAELMALLWLLGEGGVPITVIGDADATDRAELAAACVGLSPTRPWVVIDADAEAPTSERLAALLQGGVGFAMTLASPDLRSMLEAPGQLSGLPEDGVRRLGVVLVAQRYDRGDRQPVPLHGLEDRAVQRVVEAPLVLPVRALDEHLPDCGACREHRGAHHPHRPQAVGVGRAQGRPRRAIPPVGQATVARVS